MRGAAALRPLLEANQAAGDRDRRLTDEAMAAVWDTGVCRIFVPGACGGTGLGMQAAIDATAELGQGRSVGPVGRDDPQRR